MTRSAQVGVIARASNAVFGSPSASRANGLREASFVPAPLRTSSWRRRRAETPVFAVDAEEARATGKLPRIWVSERAYDTRSGRIDGREFVSCYPNGADPSGRKALALASACFAEAIGYAEDRDLITRRDCFRAAEILYLHAAARGCVEASLKLGAIYAADLCEGLYWNWGGECESDAACRMGCLPLQAQALERYSFAAVRGNAEACWQLGDMVLQGRGCLANAERAHSLFMRAYELSASQGDEESLGNAALRLGRLAEKGLGCDFSFKDALTWYRIAADHLGEVLELGAWHYKRAYHEAAAGERRMRQELSGGY